MDKKAQLEKELKSAKTTIADLRRSLEKRTSEKNELKDRLTTENVELDAKLRETEVKLTRQIEMTNAQENTALELSGRVEGLEFAIETMASNTGS